MSFEDDEYWEAEYSDQARPYADNAAVARAQYADNGRRHAPPRGQRDNDEFDAGNSSDELAARRQRRQTGHTRSPDRQRRIRSAFDADRPDWLDDPSFIRDMPPAREQTSMRDAPARGDGRRRPVPPRVDHVRDEDFDGRLPAGQQETPAEQARLLTDDWDSLVEYVDDRPPPRSGPGWADDEDYGRRPREADRAPAGRARVPEPDLDDPALDLYRPPRDGRRAP
ncbi:MAG: hypothetical protein QOH97_395, partial [Actinoplanes sp.]|nr:hypothetical protein [Actinoplanes sp.]